MGLTGRLFSAVRAAEVGLVNQVVPLAELKAAALALAAEVAANGPLGVQLTKKLMRNALTHGAESGMASTEESRAVFGSADGARAPRPSWRSVPRPSPGTERPGQAAGRLLGNPVAARR